MRRLAWVGIVILLARRRRRIRTGDRTLPEAPPPVAGPPDQHHDEKRLRKALSVAVAGLLGGAVFVGLLVAATVPTQLTDHLGGEHLPETLQEPWYQVAIAAVVLVSVVCVAVMILRQVGLDRHVLVPVVAAVTLMSGATVLLVDSSFSETWSGHFLGLSFDEVSRVILIFLYS
jgi:hypothetical protein